MLSTKGAFHMDDTLDDDEGGGIDLGKTINEEANKDSFDQKKTSW